MYLHSTKENEKQRECSASLIIFLPRVKLKGTRQSLVTAAAKIRHQVLC